MFQVMMIEFDIADDDKLYAQFLVTMRKERKRLRQRFCPQCQKDFVKFPQNPLTSQGLEIFKLNLAIGKVLFGFPAFSWDMLHFNKFVQYDQLSFHLNHTNCSTVRNLLR